MSISVDSTRYSAISHIPEHLTVLAPNTWQESKHSLQWMSLLNCSGQLTCNRKLVNWQTLTLLTVPHSQALKYVSFPTQTLAKCAKMMPVMVRNSKTAYHNCPPNNLLCWPKECFKSGLVKSFSRVVLTTCFHHRTNLRMCYQKVGGLTAAYLSERLSPKA